VKIKVLGEKPAPVLLCPSQIPTQTGLGPIVGSQGERLVSKHLGHGMAQHGIVWWIFTNVLEETAASMFFPEDGNSKFLQTSVNIYLTTTSHILKDSTLYVIFVRHNLKILHCCNISLCLKNLLTHWVGPHHIQFSCIILFII
jgi:hypothetical protein